MKRILPIILSLSLFISGCAQRKPSDDFLYVSDFEKENLIALSDEKILFNSEEVSESGDVFVSHDIIYYEEKESYPSGNPYGEGKKKDMHAKEEADSHTVLNITRSGAYRISGTLSKGQIRIDLGDNAKSDPNAKVELILDNANVTCTVAPAILFMNVYECDGDWSTENATSDVDTQNAGAVLVLADGSENNISGSYVEKIFKDSEDEKKLWKQDGAIYSYMSMNVFGDGTLNLNAANEGLDTELHLTINGGDINIFSQNDGINTNEDNVSVTTINGGNINIFAGLGEEGDGIDSNGWLVINGGRVISSANPKADAGLDSDLGSFINGGTVIALGSTMDWPESDSDQVTMNLQFSEAQPHSSAIVVKDKDGDVVFAYKCTEENETVTKRNFRGAVISSPNFNVGDEYTLYIGSELQGNEENGVYATETLTEITGGIQFGYYGTDLPGRGHGNGRPPELPDGESRPTPPDGEAPPMPFDNKFPPEHDGEKPEFRRDNPDIERPPMRNENNAGEGEQKTVFIMNDKVNLFSGVSKVKIR
jgi:hypothetical protein